ncbi:MAG: hypothetical protein WKF75_06760 [Singulisphaera sp.]
MLRGGSRDKAEAVAAACLTFEEFLGSILADDEADVAPGRVARLSFRAGPRRVLVQGHCHQRALVGPGPALGLLRRIPGAEVFDLDAGCCGMAGSFGYETEHYEVSRLIGERRLFPAVRGPPRDGRGRARVLLPAPGGTFHRPIRGASGGVAPCWPSVMGPSRALTCHPDQARRTHASRVAPSRVDALRRG